MILKARKWCSVSLRDGSENSVVTSLRELSRCMEFASFFFKMFEFAGSPFTCLNIHKADRKKRALVSISLAASVAFLLRLPKSKRAGLEISVCEETMYLSDWLQLAVDGIAKELAVETTPGVVPTPNLKECVFSM